MGDLGRPLVDQGIGESSFESGWDGSGLCLDQLPSEGCGFLAPAASTFNGKHKIAATQRQLLNECQLPPLGNMLHTMSTTRWLGFSWAFNVLWMKCPCAHGAGSSSLPAPSKYAHCCVMLPPSRWVSNNPKFVYWKAKIGLHNGHRFERAVAIFSHVLRAVCSLNETPWGAEAGVSEWLSANVNHWPHERKTERAGECVSEQMGREQWLSKWVRDWLQLGERQVLE